MPKDKNTGAEFAAWRALQRPGEQPPDKAYLEALSEVCTIDDWEALQAAQARGEDR